MSNRTGFVLLEAVVALAIVGLFSIALIAMVGRQVRTADQGSVLMIGQALADDRLATIKFLDAEALEDVPDSLRAGAFPPPFEDFEWNATVTPVQDEYDLFSVEIVVNGRGESFPLRSLVHKPRAVPQATGSL